MLHTEISAFLLAIPDAHKVSRSGSLNISFHLRNHKKLLLAAFVFTSGPIAISAVTEIGATSPASVASKKLMPDEVEARVREFALPRVWMPSQGWTDLVRSLWPDDLPLAIATVEKTAAGKNRTFLRANLYTRWGECDSRAAFAQADTYANAQERNGIIYAILDGVARTAPVTAAERILSFPSGPKRISIVRVLASSWAATDPKAAVAWIDKFATATVLERREFVSTLAVTWAQRDLKSALAYVQKQPNVKFRTEIISKFANIWGLSDPRSLVEYIQSLPSGSARTRDFNSAINLWAREDPTAARDFVLTLPSGSERDELLQAVLGTWTMRDPMAALQYVYAQPVGSRVRASLSSFVRALADQDSDAALDFVRRLAGAERDDAVRMSVDVLALTDPESALAFAKLLPPDSPMYFYAIIQLTPALAASQPKEAIALFTALPDGPRKSGSADLLVGELMRQDPKSAVALINTLPAGDYRDGVIGNAAEAWAVYNDFDGALAWVLQLPVGLGRDRAATRICFEWAERDPKAAFEYMRTISDPFTQRQFQTTLMEKWVAADPGAVRSAALGLPAGTLRDSIIVSLIPILAEHSPREAAAIVSNLSTGDFQKGAAEQLASLWAQSDSTAAAAWAVALPIGPARDGAVLAVFRILSVRDQAAAVQWIRLLPADGARDGALEFFVALLGNQSPPQAVQWISEFSNEMRRTQAISMLAERWLMSDRVTAETWLSKQAISSDQKQRLLDGRR